ncbi:MAG: hypothetical protein KUG77_03540 [Nannocystaceae bacterium]|nr:hypothetical protein [Nannocystaceae bacterium]
MSTNILGVYLGHDPTACLLVDGEIRVLIEDERLTRFKHGRPDALGRLWPRFSGRSGYFPWAAVTYCLRAAGIELDSLDALVLPAEWSAECITHAIPVLDPHRVILATSPQGGAHHWRHALSTFFASPFEEAAVLVVDDDGSVVDGQYEAESGYLFRGRHGDHELVFKNRYAQRREVRHGLGWMYHAVTNALGFRNPQVEVGEAGKTMGLAPYGSPSAAFADPWIEGEGLELDFTGFERWLRQAGLVPAALALEGAHPLLSGAQAPTPIACDLAHKVQAELERGLLRLARQLRERTGARRLCLAGGVALNSVANEVLHQESGFDEVFVVPAAGDNGQALGLAYYGHLVVEARRQGRTFDPTASDPPRPKATTTPIRPIEHAFGGRAWSHEGIAALLDATGLPHEEFRSTHEAAEAAAADLVDGRIIGWFQGRSEFGPRALGHRSILADPRSATMKDTLNRRVKFREGFRPFAPSVLASRANDVFDVEGSSPFMLRVLRVREDWRERIPAVTHIDGTARVQTVARQACPLYHRLIEAFNEHTGVPVVLNTSFNLRGMPIVESPWDALRCFLSTDMDALYLGRFQIPAATAAALAFSVTPGWTLSIASDLNASETRLLATSPAGSASSFALSPALADIVTRLDDSRDLDSVLGEQTPEVLARVTTELQTLLRAAVLRLRVGQLRFPIHRGLSDLPWERIESLVQEAGMVSALLADS